MVDYGFFLLSRKMFDGHDPFWSEDREFSRAEAWIDILAQSAWRSHDKMVGSAMIRIERGEFLGSLRYLGERWNWSKDRVGRYLAVLTDIGRIATVRETPCGTVYRVVNYSTYQSPRDTERDTARDSNATATRQQRDKENERKEGKEREELDRGRSDSGTGQTHTEEEGDGDENVSVQLRHGATGAVGVDSDPGGGDRDDGPSAEDVRAVLEGCNAITGRDLSLTRDRREKIKTRLREGFSVAELLDAMRGAHAQPFFRGDNDRSARYDAPETVFRTGGKVETHIEHWRRVEAGEAPGAEVGVGDGEWDHLA